MFGIYHVIFLNVQQYTTKTLPLAVLIQRIFVGRFDPEDFLSRVTDRSGRGCSADDFLEEVATLSIHTTYFGM